MTAIQSVITGCLPVRSWPFVALFYFLPSVDCNVKADTTNGCRDFGIPNRTAEDVWWWAMWKEALGWTRRRYEERDRRFEVKSLKWQITGSTGKRTSQACKRIDDGWWIKKKKPKRYKMWRRLKKRYWRSKAKGQGRCIWRRTLGKKV